MRFFLQVVVRETIYIKYIDIYISMIYGLIIDPHNDQLPVGLIA